MYIKSIDGVQRLNDCGIFFFQICQLEALSLKQRALVKSSDQDKSALKRELDALHSQLISTRNKVIKNTYQTKRKHFMYDVKP